MRTFKKTSELLVGERALCHGSVYIITGTKTYEDNIVVCTLDYQGPFTYPDGSQYEAIPRHWRKDWTIQGNDNAVWEVLP